MVRHDDETGVEEQVAVEHTLLHRAVPQGFHHRDDVGRPLGGIAQPGDLRGPPERLQRADTAPHQVCDHGSDQRARQLLRCLARVDTQRGQ